MFLDYVRFCCRIHQSKESWAAPMASKCHEWSLRPWNACKPTNLGGFRRMCLPRIPPGIIGDHRGALGFGSHAVFLDTKAGSLCDILYFNQFLWGVCTDGSFSWFLLTLIVSLSENYLNASIHKFCTQHQWPSQVYFVPLASALLPAKPLKPFACWFEKRCWCDP